MALIKKQRGTEHPVHLYWEQGAHHNRRMGGVQKYICKEDGLIRKSGSISNITRYSFSAMR